MSREKNLYLWSLLVEEVKKGSHNLPVKRDEMGDFRLTREDGRSFCNVVVFGGHVSVFLIATAYIPDLTPPDLLARKTGRVTFQFKDEDDPLISRLGELVERCHAARWHY